MGIAVADETLGAGLGKREKPNCGASANPPIASSKIARLTRTRRTRVRGRRVMPRGDLLPPWSALFFAGESGRALIAGIKP